MMIRQDFTPELPPKEYIMQVCDNVIKVYCYLWDNKNSDFTCKIQWKEISKVFSKNTFRTAVRKLCAEGLLNFKETDKGSNVELTGWFKN